MRTRHTTRQHTQDRCDSCDEIAVGTLTFVAVDGEHRFAACLACATDALTHPAVHVRLRFQATRTGAEIARGLPGGDAA